MDPSDPEYDALQKEVIGARIIYFFGHLSIQDFQELLTLCIAGFGYGAFKILRGLYEKTLTFVIPKDILDYSLEGRPPSERDEWTKHEDARLAQQQNPFGDTVKPIDFPGQS